MNYIYRITFILFLTTSTLVAQNKDIEVRKQTWFAYMNQTRLTSRSGIWLDLHLRLTDDFVNKKSLTITRVGYTYYIADNTRLTIGYAFINQFGYGSPDVPEHRPWQQLQWIEKKSWFTLSQWIRLEERFRRKVVNNELSGDYAFNYRVRYNMLLTVPLTKKVLEPKTPFAYINNELHINAGKQIVNNYFDQNRFSVGFGYQFTKQLQAQLGYLYVFQQLPTANRFVEVQGLRLVVNHTLDLRHRD